MLVLGTLLAIICLGDISPTTGTAPLLNSEGDPPPIENNNGRRLLRRGQRRRQEGGNEGIFRSTFEKRTQRIAVASAQPSLAGGRYPFFVHLHKAAGTYLCELAIANGHRAAGVASIGTKPLGFNCNILGDDPGHLGLGVSATKCCE